MASRKKLTISCFNFELEEALYLKVGKFNYTVCFSKTLGFGRQFG